MSPNNTCPYHFYNTHVNQQPWVEFAPIVLLQTYGATRLALQLLIFKNERLTDHDPEEHQQEQQALL